MADSAATRYPATQKYSGRRDPDRGSGVGLKLFAVFAGLALGALIPIGIWMASSAQNARDDARAAAAKSPQELPS